MVDWLEITVRQPGYRNSNTANLETGSASATLRDHELVVVKLILMFFVLIPQSGKIIYFLAPALTCPSHPPPIRALHRCNTAYCNNYISICEANHGDVTRCRFEKQSSLISIFAPRLPNLFHNFLSFFVCLSLGRKKK